MKHRMEVYYKDGMRVFSVYSWDIRPGFIILETDKNVFEGISLKDVESFTSKAEATP